MAKSLFKLDINTIVAILANQICYKLGRSKFSSTMHEYSKTDNVIPTRLRSVQLKMLRHLLLLLLKLVKLVVKRKIRRIMLSVVPLLLLLLPFYTFLSNHSAEKELSPKILR